MEGPGAPTLGRGGVGRRIALTGVALVVLSVSLRFAYGERARCLTGPEIPGPYRTCYTDVASLYERRGLDTRPVYSGDGILEEVPDGDLEYPPGIAIVVGIAIGLSDDHQGYFRINAIVIAIATMASLLIIAALTTDPKRLLLFAGAPAILIHGFTNWELVAVLPMVAGLASAHLRRPASAGALIGLGAMTKVFPLFALPAVAASFFARRREAATSVLACTLAIVLVAATTLLIAGEDSFLWFAFNAERAPIRESIWAIVTDAFGDTASVRSLVSAGSAMLVAASIGIAVMLEHRRSQRNADAFRLFSVAFASMCFLLAFSKVASPQITLMLVPFFAIVRVPWYAWVLHATADIATQIIHLNHGSVMSDTHAMAIAQFGVFLAIGGMALRSPEAVRRSVREPS